MDMSGKERREKVWEAMKGSFVSFLGDMLKEWIKNQIIRETLGKAAETASVASAAVTGTAVASAWSAAAAATSLATLGANAAPASAGITATYGLTKTLSKAQYGMDEIVTQPTLIMAGEGGKAEHIGITPLEGPNIDGPQGGQTINVSIQGNVMTDQFVEEELSEKISEAIRRGVDFGIS